MNDCEVRKWRVRRLHENENVRFFTCGDSDLDDYILNEASSYQSELLAVNYVLEDENENVLAFMALLNDRIGLMDFSSSADFNRFRSNRFVSSKRYKGYPAIKIGRIGVSSSAARSGIGSMLIDFVKHYFVTKSKSGCRFITVDAYNGAIDFYVKNGFTRMTQCNTGNTSLLYFDLLDYKNKL